MVIIRFSVDRTRWDSLKITTHLNFVSGNFPSDKSNTGPGTEMLDSPVTMGEPATPMTPVDPSKERERVMVGDHVRPSSDIGLGFAAPRYAENLSCHSLSASILSKSKSSLPDFYV
jgi:hypothetical protein